MLAYVLMVLHSFTKICILADFEDTAVADYTAQLKNSHKSRYVLQNRWPPFTPTTFINLGYIIHDPERTSQEAKNTAISETLGREKEPIHIHDTIDSDKSLNSNVTIEEEVDKIFLPVSSTQNLQIILIEGVPGIGKTMLMMEIRHLWANDKILNDTKVLLLFSLRDPKINNFKSIKDMFYHFCKDKKNSKIYAKHFVKNSGKGLAILLDGFDENPQALQCGTFFHDILIKDKTFVKACIIITSRPHETAKLQQLIRYRVEIIGFTKDRRHDYVEKNLKEKAKDLLNYLEDHEIIDTLCYVPLNMSIVVYLCKSNVKLKELPNNQTELTKQAVRMTVLHNLEKLELTKSKGNSENLRSKNDLKNLPKPFNKIFYYLSELAYKALHEKKLTFTSDEIRKACPVPTNGNTTIERAITNGMGLIHAAQFFNEGDGEIELLSNFAHYSVQELLAAWYIAFTHCSYCQLLPLPCSIRKSMQNCLRFLFQLKVLRANFWKGDNINVWSFYVGLTEGNDFAFKCFLTSNMFSCHMPCKAFSTLHMYKASSHMVLQEATPHDIPELMDVVQCTKKRLKNKLNALLLYYVLQEAPKSEVIEYIDAIITKDELDISEQVLEDLYLLGNILSRPYLTKQWKSVNLSYCEIDDEKFRILHEVLTRNDGRFKPKIEALLLSGNKLKSCDDAIANLACRQEILYLDLSNNVLKNFSSLQRCDFLVTLDISNNKLNNEKVALSLTALQFLRKLKVLNLKHNNIHGSQDVIDAIGLALCSCNSLEELELDGNDTTFVDKTILLFNVIKELRNSKTNKHSYSEQPDIASAFLKILEYCNKIDYQHDMCTLRNIIIQSEVIDISCNGLKTENGCNLGQNLPLLINLKILIITKNNISDEATESLFIGIILCPHLKQFKYDKNLFSEDSTVIFNMIWRLRMTPAGQMFKYVPPKVEALLFILNCINDNEEKVQSSDIVSTISLITELNLSHNKPTTLDYKLTSEDIKKLCAVLRWFKQLEVLDVSNNEITVEARTSLEKVMLQICTLNSIKLIGNPLYDDKPSMTVFDTIIDVREKQVQSIVCNQNSPHHIGHHPIFYVMDCLSQFENPSCFKSFDNITTVDVDSEEVKVLEYLTFLPFLKILKVNNVPCITDCGMYQLGKYLSQNKTLTTLDLSGCNLKNLEGKLKDGTSNNIPIEVLKLNHSNVTVEVLSKLFNMITLTKLTQLELEGNHFGHKGISILYNKLRCENDQPNATISILNLAGNQFTTSSAITIVEMVAMYKVKCLNISNNDLGNILPHFENCTIPTLEELNISANNHQKDNAVVFIKSLSYLNSCSSLTKLNISNDNIDETAKDEIFLFFMKCSHFEEVICTGNPAENEIDLAFHLVKNLHSQQGCVTHIKFKQRPIPAQALISNIALPYDDQIGALATSVKVQVSQVTSIDFSYNYMKIDEDFVCLLQNCYQLEALNLEHNDITNEAFKYYLATGIIFTSKLLLPKLQLSGNPCMVVDKLKNEKVLQIIHALRSKSIYYRPPSFEQFLIVLELVDRISEKQNDIIKHISLITYLDISNAGQPSDLKDANQKLQSCHIKNTCKYLKHFKSLKSIDMIDNNIEEDAMDDLAIALLKHSNINEILLKGNPIHKISKCNTLFDTIIKMRTCGRSYTLKRNLEFENLEVLVTILQYINSFDDTVHYITDNIEQLNVSWFYQPQYKSQFGIEKMEEMSMGLIRHLKLFSKLKTLNLSHVYLAANGLQELSRFLQNNNTLLELDISYNNIQAEGALVVLKSLDKNKPLTKLKLACNQITGEKCYEMATIIHSLQIKADVSGNKLTENSKKILGLK